MVDRAYQTLTDLGRPQVRVRVPGEGDHPLARIELTADEIGDVLKPENIETIRKKFEEIGFSYVTLDLNGYKTGSMNKIMHR